MGKSIALREYSPPRRPLLTGLPRGLVRRRPRQYAEWKWLKKWNKLPVWESESVGFLMRLAREKAGLTQKSLSRGLGCSQQAVAQAERWDSNPTVDFLRRWMKACGATLALGPLFEARDREGYSGYPDTVDEPSPWDQVADSPDS